MTKQEALFEYCLRLGDTALILGQRISEWCGHAPMLEEDIAMSNIALDHIGQARIILSYACEVESKGRKEDDLAYHRDARQYRNLLLAEQPNGDFGMTICRQYFISVYNFHLYTQLSKSSDASLAAYAAKSLKEVAYHVRHSHDWVLRLGDGTAESKARMQNAVDDLWFYVDDIFEADEVDDILLKDNIAADMKEIKSQWEKTVAATLAQAGLKMPEIKSQMRMGSRKGNHTEHLGYILAEMQFLPRAYPDAAW